MKIKKLIVFTDGSELLSYEELQERFHDMMVNVSYKFYNKLNAELNYEMEDIMQEARLVLFRSFKFYDGSKGVAFSTYLYPSLKFHMIKLCKRRRPAAVSLNEKNSSDAEDPTEFIDSLKDEADYEGKAINNVLFIDILKNIEKLHPTQRAAIEGIYFRSLKQREIAELCNVKQSVVSRAEKKGVEKLRMAIGL